MPNLHPKTDHLEPHWFKPASNRPLQKSLTSVRLYADQLLALKALDGTISDNIRQAIDEYIQNYQH